MARFLHEIQNQIQNRVYIQKRVINHSLASLKCNYMYLTIGFSTCVECMLTMTFLLSK